MAGLLALFESSLQARERAVRALEERSRRYASARLFAFGAGLVALWAIGERDASGWWFVASVLLFLVLLAPHGRVQRAQAAARRASLYYREGLERLRGTWAGRGVREAGLPLEHHLYAADLDLFGEGSLFELLCQARTQGGERRLAEWVTQTAQAETVRERQQAVRELVPLLDLRERVASAWEGRSLVRASLLLEWVRQPERLKRPWIRVVSVCLGNLGLLALAAWALGAPSKWFAGIFVVATLFDTCSAGEVSEVLHGVDGPRRDLAQLQAVAQALETPTLRSPLAQRLQERLTGGLSGLPASGETLPASVCLARLERELQMLEARRNPFFIPFGLVLLWNTRMAFAVEDWRRAHGQALEGWLEAVAELEALLCLAGYTFEHPDNVFPEVLPEGRVFVGKDLRHPLLPADRAVPNDLTLGPTSLILISGSNMAGKSSLLRTVGTCTVLALAGCSVPARSLQLSVLRLGASIRVGDSLRSGISRFYSELLRLRALVEAASQEPPLLFLLDEVMHGTNSHDRVVGASAVIETLVRRGALGLVTTHDLALTRVVERLGQQAVNMHFADHLEEGRLCFDYRLKSGVVGHSNALALMRAVGLDVEEPRAN